MKVVYPAFFHYENGGFWGEFPDLPGCVSQGDSEVGVYRNACEALELFLQDNYTVANLPPASSLCKIEATGRDFSSLVSAGFSENITHEPARRLAL